MVKRRVAITGIGAVTPIGSGVEGLWAGVRSGRSAVRPVTRFDPSPFRSRLAAEIDDFDAARWIEPKRLKRLDRFSQLAVVAAVQAARDAGIERDVEVREQAGCYLGSALGGVAFGEEQHRAYLLDGGAGAVSPTLALAVFAGAGASNVAIELGLRGPSLSNSNSCASGAVAIGEAFRLVRDGHVPLMLAGGAEAPLAPLTYGSFALIKAMSTANDTPERASRPFDRERDGFVMGEGAAVLVLEDLDRARARGARLYAELLGYATTNDAFHMLQPHADGQEAGRAVAMALDDASVTPTQVDYVNAHASGTPIGDRAEAAALRRSLGERARSVPVSGTKGLYGHPLGAAGAVEAALTSLALDSSYLPGTANYRQPDSAIELNVLPPSGLQARAEVALSTSFGFGGVNAALVFGRSDRRAASAP